MKIEKLKKRLQKIEAQLENNRPTVREDGWQTMRYAKKSRTWDILAQKKNEIRYKIMELEECQNSERNPS